MEYPGNCRKSLKFPGLLASVRPSLVARRPCQMAYLVLDCSLRGVFWHTISLMQAEKEQRSGTFLNDERFCQSELIPGENGKAPTRYVESSRRLGQYRIL